MFFVRSEEIGPCPCCQGRLGVIGSRKRVSIQSTGESVRLIIHRLRCKKCRRIHHELPNILVPHKRYEAQSIENVVSNPVNVDVAADESTLYRRRNWFALWGIYASRCLDSIAKRFNLPVEGSPSLSQSTLQGIGRFVGNATGWLGRAVRPIANTNLWIHTRSAFLS